MTVPLKEQSAVAVAVAQLVDRLHRQFQGLRIQPVTRYEDEDFALEVRVPKELPAEHVEEICHKECMDMEDCYDVYILAMVKQAH